MSMGCISAQGLWVLYEDLCESCGPREAVGGRALWDGPELCAGDSV